MAKIDLGGIKQTTERCKAKMKTPTDVVLVGNTELLIAALAESREALEVARHELTTLHGLVATDRVGDVPEGSWRIDTNTALARIDAAL